MIRSLDDAWAWYEGVKTLIAVTDRMARRYWSDKTEGMTLKDALHRDEMFRHLEPLSLQELAVRVRSDLDDLVVLLLFSVFEATVRDRTLDEMEREMPPSPRHLMLRKAMDDARDAVAHGSFGRITEAFRELDANTKTQVDQVRHYRNWVAHGRRGDVRNNVDPVSSKMRLERFLALLDDASGAAGSTPTGRVELAPSPPQEPPNPGAE